MYVTSESFGKKRRRRHRPRDYDEYDDYDDYYDEYDDYEKKCYGLGCLIFLVFKGVFYDLPMLILQLVVYFFFYIAVISGVVIVISVCMNCFPFLLLALAV